MIGAAENFRSSPHLLRSKPVRINVGIGTRRCLKSDVFQPLIAMSGACVVLGRLAADRDCRMRRGVVGCAERSVTVTS